MGIEHRAEHTASHLAFLFFVLDTCTAANRWYPTCYRIIGQLRRFHQQVEFQNQTACVAFGWADAEDQPRVTAQFQDVWLSKIRETPLSEVLPLSDSDYWERFITALEIRRVTMEVAL